MFNLVMVGWHYGVTKMIRFSKDKAKEKVGESGFLTTLFCFIFGINTVFLKLDLVLTIPYYCTSDLGQPIREVGRSQTDNPRS